MIANKSKTTERDFHNIEAGLDVLRRNIHVVSDSERGFITKLFIRFFPHTDYSKNAVQKEHQRFLNTQFLYRVALGKEEKGIIDRFRTDHYKSSIVKTVSDATFREMSGTILAQYDFSKGASGSKLSTLHQKVMQAYLKNKKNKEEGKPHWELDSIEDFYKALILGGAEYLHSPELGFLRDLSLIGIKFHDFHSHAAYTFISLAFSYIHEEIPEQSSVENARTIEQHYNTSGSETKKLLSRAYRRIETHRNDPKQGFDLITELIQTEEFQRIAAYHLEYILKGETPFDTRLSTYKNWITREIEQYCKNTNKNIVIDADTLALFHAAAWIAARDQLSKDTIHQLKSMLDLHDLVEPAAEAQNTLITILIGLKAATDTFAQLPRKAGSKT